MLGHSVGMDLPSRLRRQHGVVTHAQALAAGLTVDAIQWRLTRGSWVRLARGIYHAYPGEITWLGRAHALALRLGPTGALTLNAAAHLHGVESRQPPVISGSVTGRQVTRMPGTRVLRSSHLDVVTRRGLPVTSAATTALDLSACPGVLWREAVHLTARWVHSGTTSADEIAAALADRARHQHRRALTLALDPIAGGVESILELQSLRRVVTAHGLPRPRLQVLTDLPGGRVRRDAEWEEFGVVLEADGDLVHTGPMARVDRRRDRHTARTGRVTLRAGFVEIEHEPCELAVDIFLTLRSRGFDGRIEACRLNCPARGPTIL